jgi:hypothetical protein
MTGARLVSSLIAGLTGLLLMSPVQAAPRVGDQVKPGFRFRLATPRLWAEIPNEPAADVAPAEPSEEAPASPPVHTRPYTLDYQPGQPIPPGYRVVSRPHRAELTLGSIMLGISYTVSAILAASRAEASATAESFGQVPYDPRWLYVPVIGPWVALATSLKSHDCRNSYYASSYFYGQCESANDDLGAWRIRLAIDGLAQGVGAALAIHGIKWRWHQLVLTNDVWAELLPVPMGRGGEGLALVGRFSGL